MGTTIPFVKDIRFEYGDVDQVSPLIRRVIANNPGPFTFTGTGTYIIGHDKVAVVDPGPNDPAHIDALMQALEGETVTHILITHTHMDHSPGAAPLQQRTGAKTYGFGPHARTPAGEVVEEGGDMAFVPDIVTKHGDIIHGEGWTVEAVHTPGHTSNHLCFALLEEKVLFSGDHVMGWSTSVVSPPDGDMAAYLNSLHLLLERDEEVYWPTHGPAIHAPRQFVKSFIAHREEREVQILEQVRQGHRTIREMVPVMYAAVDSRLHPAAARSVLAHVKRMVEDGRLNAASAEIRQETELSPGPRA